MLFKPNGVRLKDVFLNRASEDESNEYDNLITNITIDGDWVVTGKKCQYLTAFYFDKKHRRFEHISRFFPSDTILTVMEH
jgi:hypothetical protein